MNILSARRWIIWASLIASGLVFLFLMLAPIFGYPLTWEQALRIMELVVPVFFGYLGTGTHFLFASERPETRINTPTLLGLLVKGPIILFGIMVAAGLIAFGFSNRLAAPAGEGMSVDALAAIITICLGLLAITTNVIVAHLFALEKKALATELSVAQSAGGEK